MDLEQYLSPEVAHEQIMSILEKTKPSPQLAAAFVLPDTTLLLMKQLRGEANNNLALIRSASALNPEAYNSEDVIRATAFVEVYDYLIKLHESATTPTA